MTTIDDYLERIDEALSCNDKKKQESLLEEIFIVFKNDIKDIKSGTYYDAATYNMAWNALNGDVAPLPEEYNYDSDLRLVSEKLRLLRDSQQTSNNAPAINKTTNVTINNSKIKNSTIASSVRGKNGRLGVFEIVVGIFTILGTIAAVITIFLSQQG